MRTATELTVARAWTQLLKLEDGALADLTPGRITRRDPKARAVTFVRLLSHGVIVGPQWAIDRAADRSDDELAELQVLQELTADHDSRPLGAATLSFTDVSIDGLPEAVTADDDATVATLEGRCPPEDVEEVGLAGMPTRWVVLGSSPEAPREKAPAAAAGFVVWADVLAHLGVLTAPDQRRQGQGTVAAGLAINAALAAGLLPQWRSRADNEASQQLARRLGFQPLGSQTTVHIDRR
ncbi:GNAT family N-acetyltransferase [Ornithinimicrobium cryptoxanthini]|uniref:GNAT family N-acetyltransferase n=1 Tax=Ornithinimicrobium cryptoxanthini TaxID=2934161 RepID=A0ABY4YL31_9MICO|nr:GNAT family N-acetyltransferase [Ornithinimicrobium cryptoxanthini]USQ77497.1 GNAT family N-acetyltransferase [Ornithinimicrobium cryptoxanthini]